MSDTVKIEIKGLEELGKKLNIWPAFKAALKAGAVMLKGRVSKYPPGGEWNQPGRYSLKTHRKMGWYVRGRGGYSPSGKLVTRSETLGRRWTQKTEDDGLTVRIGNNVSYGPFVQDREKQARFHALHGWRTVQDVAEQDGEEVKELITKEVQKLFDG